MFVSFSQTLSLSFAVIPTEAKRRGGTCSCFSTLPRFARNCHSDRSEAEWRNLRLLFNAPALCDELSFRPKRSGAEEPAVAFQRSRALRGTVIPTEAKRSGGTCGCFSTLPRFARNCHSDRSEAERRNLQLLFNAPALCEELSFRPKRSGAEEPAVAFQRSRALRGTVIPTEAKQSGGTCSCSLLVPIERSTECCLSAAEDVVTLSSPATDEILPTR